MPSAVPAMDLTTAIGTAGASIVSDVTSNLVAVAPIALGVIGVFIVFGLALKAFRKSRG